MACRFDKEKLADYYDGEATPDERTSVEAHIAGCSDCLRDLGDLKATSGAVKSLKRVSAPPAILKGIEQEIVRPAAPSFRQARTWMQWGVSVAAVGLICASIVIISRRSPDFSQAVQNEARIQEKAAKPMAAGRAAPEEMTGRLESASKDEGAAPPLKKNSGDPSESESWKRESDDKEKAKESRHGVPKMGAGHDGESMTPPKAAMPKPQDPKPDGKPAQESTPQHEDLTQGYEGGRGESKKEESKSDDPTKALSDKPAPIEVLALSSKDIAATRAGIEKLMGELRRKITVGSESIGAQGYVKDHYVEVELTDAEYEALLKDLDKSKTSIQKTDSEAEAKLVADRSAELSARGSRLGSEEKSAKGGGKKDDAKAPPPAPAGPGKAMAESTERELDKDAGAKRRKIILAFREPAPSPAPASKK